ncbi:glucose dehydrogenase [FAD, quinone]-like [Bacillus rossius redtenbacheri]|uniref:glucose dehydrogenase [FAD, quinone]-like n=1 Tax=Bacillus rossius redtenbacheri TaxID=93214 RepID=UPI002FDDE908
MLGATLLLTAQRTLLVYLFYVVLYKALDVALRVHRPDVDDAGGRVRDLEDLGRHLRRSYDFVVVGAGSTGCVVANRLSEERSWSVLLLEAGGDETLVGQVPFMVTTYQRTSTDWRYRTEADPGFCRAMLDGRCLWPRGKVLGGTSAINGMLYVRGNRRDYDNWQRLGNEGWAYDDVLPYFKKSEDMKVDGLRDSPYHGTGGYLSVELFRYYSPLMEFLVRGIEELGFPVRDINGESQTGFMYSYGTLRNGFRCSSARAFLRPVKDRRNLDVSMNSHVERVVIDPRTRTARGVEFLKHGRRHMVTALKEVVICAGAINSPQLLMLSGIGPVHHLKEVGVSPVISNLNVGGNLQDHICAGGIAYTIEVPLGITLLSLLNVSLFTDMLLNSNGMLMNIPIAHVIGFQSSSIADSQDHPDIGYYLGPSADNVDRGVALQYIAGYTDEFYKKVYEHILFKDAFLSWGCLLRPKSRGYIRLKDDNPKSHPLIYPEYLRHPDDVKILVEAAKLSHRLSQTTPLRKIGARVNPNKFPGCEHLEMLSDEYLECALRTYPFTLWHFSGTCKMGPGTDPDAVVDPRLRVYGVRGLRVADASIMPDVVSGNLNVPCIMIGEKVSDMIKEDWFEFFHKRRFYE